MSFTVFPGMLDNNLFFSFSVFIYIGSIGIVSISSFGKSGGKRRLVREIISSNLFVTYFRDFYKIGCISDC